MFVAIPTAIPDVPLTRRFGNLPGNVTGSSLLSSKFKLHFIVSLSISLKSSNAKFSRRHSLYLYASGGSPSIEPKFP